ncbi:hypothetical protein JW758_04460 [Candidatus Peregrinibacteria bacterium]|nr:hypothetical protein [Candidatus Peregrinibacteria bacterium]
MADNANPQQGAEEFETQNFEVLDEKETEMGLNEFSHAAEMMESDENMEPADKIRNLRGSDVLPPPEEIKTNPESARQWDKITVFSMAIGGIVAKLKKEGADISSLRENPVLLKHMVDMYGIDSKLTLPERTALDNIDRILGTPGPTTNFLLKEGTWTDIVDEGEGSVSSYAKVKNFIKKHPAGTAGVILAGMAGLYIFGDSLTGWWRNKKAKKDGGEVTKRSWFRKEVLIPVGLFLFGMFMGKNALKEVLGKMSVEDLKGLLEKGGVIPKDVRGELEKRIEQLEKANEKLLAKGKDAATKAKSTVADATGTVTGAVGNAKNKISGAANEIKEAVEFEVPSEILIRLYCFDNYRFKETRRDVRKVFDDLRGKNMSDIVSLWNKYKITDDAEGSIPNNNELVKIHSAVDSKNIYLAFKIIATTYEVYNKRLSGGSYSTMTFENFMVNHVANDPVYKINNGIQASLITALKERDPKKLNFEAIKSTIEGKKQEYMEKLAQRLGLDLKDVNKTHFTSLIIKKSQEYTLEYDENDIIKNIDTNKYDKNTIEAVKLFFKKIKILTLGTVIPKCVDRFNITNKYASKGNEDIIQNQLDEKIGFDKAIQLGIVSLNIDFDKGVKEGSSQMEELALLYAILDSIPEEFKQKYLSELISLIISSPSSFNVPSLAFLLPYFGKMKDFGIEMVKSEVEQAGNWTSAFVNERTPEQQKEWLKKIRNADAVDFGLETAKEAGSGTLRIGKDLLNTLTNIVGTKEISKVSDAWDIISLITAAGGNFIISKNEKDQHTGVLYLAGKYFFYKPMGIVKDSMNAWVKGAQENNSGLGSAIKTYVAATSPFVVIGGLNAYRINRHIAKNGWDLLARTALGSGKGALAPLTLPAKGAEIVYRIGRWGKESVQTAFNVTKQLSHGVMPGNNINIMLRDAEYVKHYFKLKPNSNMGWWQEVKWAKKQGLAKGAQRLFLPAWNERMLIKYTNKFLRRYNSFFGRFDKDVNLIVETLSHNSSYGQIKDAFKLADKTTEFFDKLTKHPDFLIAKNDDTGKSMAKLIKTVGSSAYSGVDAGDLLHPQEIAHLQRNLTKSGGLKKFLRLLNDAKGNIGIENKPGPIRRFFSRPNVSPESLVNFKTNDVLKSAISDLSDVNRRVADATSKLEQARKSGKGIEKAEEALEMAKKAETNLSRTVEHLNEIKKIETELAQAKKAGASVEKIDDLLKGLREAKGVALSSLEAAQESSQAIKQVGKLAKFGRFLGKAIPAGFAALSLYEAGLSGYEAATTDVQGRAAISGGKAALWTANAAADITGLAVGATARGVAGVAGRLWIPLMPITYAGTEIFDTLNERTLTEGEWAQKYSYDELMHQWFTTMGSVSTGDVLVSGFSSLFALESNEKGIERNEKEKAKSAHKIYRFMVSAQKNPEIINILGTEESSKSKRDKIEQGIKQTYNKNHEFYFQHNSFEGVDNYQDAEKYVTEAQLFDDIMQIRQRKKAEKVTELMVGDINLMDERYEISGTTEHPVSKSSFPPSFLVKEYKKGVVESIKQQSSKEMFANMESMETPYLLRLSVQIYSQMENKSQFEEKPELAQFLVEALVGIKDYLTCQRDVNFNIAIRKYNFSEPKMSLDELTKHLEDFSVTDSPSYKNFEKNNTDMTPGVNAIYRLAQYFGYKGDRREENLKEFMNEEVASYHGIYWDGKEWTVRERGYELDDEIGSDLNESTVREMVKLLRENPDNIIGHRSDTLFIDSYDYTHQVKQMANILEQGYAEGVKKFESAPREMYAKAA